MKRSVLPRLLLTLSGAIAVAGCNVELNDDVIIPAGAERSEGASTVNGDVVVGERAVVRDGSFKSVNGSVRVDSGAEIGPVSTVNGAIRIGAGAATGSLETVNGLADCDEKARINGDITLVNGKVRVRPGAIVRGDIETINGEIALFGAIVEGGVGNYNGGMTITDGSVVKGDLVVHEATRGSDEPPRIVIGRNARVDGELRFERPVRLHVHESASIGRVTGAEVRTFSGDMPDDG